MKVTGVRTKPYYFQMSRPYADANFPEGRIWTSGLAVFLDTDEGLTGVGISSPGAAGAVQSLGSILIGEDPRGVRGLWKKMVDRVFKGGNRGIMGDALSCLDAALWDLKAKYNNEPLWRTLGASEPRVKAYASDIGLCLSDDELRAFYSHMADMGISDGKLKVGLDMESDLRRLGIMKECLSRNSKRPGLAIDSNEYWSPKQAIRYIREMERHYELLWAEEPARRWDYAGLKKVSDNVTTAVATGENLDDIGDYMALIDYRAADIIEIGIGTSGITGAMQVAHMCYGFEIPVCMMGTPGSFMAHVAAALPNHIMMEVPDLGLECCFTVDTRIENGWIVLGDKPGLGIEFDERRLQELSRPGRQPQHPIAPGRRVGAGLYIVPPSEADNANKDY